MTLDGSKRVSRLIPVLPHWRDAAQQVFKDRKTYECSKHEEINRGCIIVTGNGCHNHTLLHKLKVFNVFTCLFVSFLASKCRKCHKSTRSPQRYTGRLDGFTLHLVDQNR